MPLRKRARTDAAWARLGDRLSGERPSRPHAAASVGDAGQALQTAREGADRVLARPKAERDPAQLRAAVHGMVRVVPLLAPVVDVFAAEAQTALPALAEDVQGARLAAELREYAGPLGSHFTAPLTHRAAFRVPERLQVERTLGCIDQLRFLL